MAMLNLQRCLIGLDVPLVIPGRKLIKSGILVKQGRRADEERAFFLFTDILVYADVAYSWSIPGLSNSMDGLSHGVSPSMSSEKSRLSIVWPSSGLPSGQGGVNPQYTFKHLFQLEDVTVTATDGQVFEVRTAIKSFSLVAGESLYLDFWMPETAHADLTLSQYPDNSNARCQVRMGNSYPRSERRTHAFTSKSLNRGRRKKTLQVA